MDFDLPTCLEMLCQESSTEQCMVNFNCSASLNTMEDQKKIALYRVFQELITNAIRHGHPSEINVQMHTTETAVILSCEDDGTGFDRSAKHFGRGLVNVADRIEVLHGVLEIDSRQGEGTFVSIVIPLLKDA